MWHFFVIFSLSLLWLYLFICFLMPIKLIVFAVLCIVDGLEIRRHPSFYVLYPEPSLPGGKQDESLCVLLLMDMKPLILPALLHPPLIFTTFSTYPRFSWDSLPHQIINSSQSHSNKQLNRLSVFHFLLCLRVDFYLK